MERLDQATTDLIKQEVKGHFPEGTLDSVAVLQYGDDPAVEPGQAVIQLTVGSAAGAEGGEGEPLEAFHRVHRDAIRQLQLDICQRWPQANRFKMVTGEGEGQKFMWRAPVPGEPKDGDLTPVMARLGPEDLETLDALITAGIATSRAEAVRWALARIRERPAYAKLRERVREIDELKAQF